MGQNTGGRNRCPWTSVETRLKIFLSIDPDPFVPDALSHQQLNALLKAAMDESAVPQGQLSDDELLRAALSAWADQTQELLRWIEAQGDAVSDIPPAPGPAASVEPLLPRPHVLPHDTPWPLAEVGFDCSHPAHILEHLEAVHRVCSVVVVSLAVVTLARERLVLYTLQRVIESH